MNQEPAIERDGNLFTLRQYLSAGARTYGHGEAEVEAILSAIPPAGLPAVILRPATMDDAYILLNWRNDPLTREQSVNSEPVSLPDHLRWLESSLDNPARTLLIASNGSGRVGTVRIDRGEETELSWTVAPKHRGKRIGKAMVMAAMPEGPVMAHIKQGNTASQRIAEAAGFRLANDGPLQKWIRP